MVVVVVAAAAAAVAATEAGDGRPFVWRVEAGVPRGEEAPRGTPKAGERTGRGGDREGGRGERGSVEGRVGESVEASMFHSFIEALGPSRIHGSYICSCMLGCNYSSTLLELHARFGDNMSGNRV